MTFTLGLAFGPPNPRFPGINVIFGDPDVVSFSFDDSVGRNLILAHAYAVKVYREEFKPRQNGQIGITLNGDWEMPYDDSPESESCARSKMKATSDD